MILTKKLKNKFYFYIASYSCLGLIAYEMNLKKYYYEITLLSFFILVLYLISVKKVSKPKITSGFYIFFFAYIISYSVSIIYNSDTLGLIRLILSITCIIVLLFSMNNKKIIDNLLTVILFSTLPLLIITPLIEFNYLNSIWTKIHERNSSIFFDPNYASAFFGLSALISLICIKNFIIKTILFCSFSFFTLLTFSKAGVASLVTSSIFIYLQNTEISFPKKIFSLLFILLAISFFLNYIDLDMFRLYQGLNSRDNLWSIAINSLLEKQNIFGVGLSNIESYLSEHGLPYSSTHNFYFDTTLAYGLLPLLLNIYINFRALSSSIFTKDTFAPILIFLFIQSNSILLSFGGMGILSIIYTILLLRYVAIKEKIKFYAF